MATRYFIPTDQATKRFYLFTQSWPLALTYHKEFANGGTKKLNNICTWVMHGLWLNAIQMGRFPVTFPPLTEEQKSQLAAYENPTDSQSDASFHQAMYEKHGLPCIHYTNEKIITNSETYLCKAAALAAKYDINKYLKDIKPKTESQSAYKISHLIEEGIKMEELADLQKHNTGDESIKSQIKSLQDGEVRFRPLIHTLTDDVGNQYIDQVYLYFDLNFKLIDNPYMEMSPVMYEPCIESPAQASSSSSSVQLNLQFIFCTAVTFLFLVINFFIFYKTSTIEMENTSPYLEIFYTTRSVYVYFLIYKIIAVGSRIKNTKKITHSLLNKSGVLCKSEEAIAEVSAAIGSYLLLFIQFDFIFTN